MNVNMTAFSIANFKAFAASQRIPLRPITLIYGANSSGKSSAIHALALAHHAVETGDLDVQRTGIGGESIDLGGFRQYVHRREQTEMSNSVLNWIQRACIMAFRIPWAWRTRLRRNWRSGKRMAALEIHPQMFALEVCVLGALC